MTVALGAPSVNGVRPAQLSAFLDALEADPRIEPHGLIVQHHGVRVAEGYWAPHAPRSRLVYSLSKTFTGTALGLQVGEGRLSLDDPVSSHLPELFVDADELTASMQVRHIASMATGHDREMLLEAFVADPDDPLRGFFGIPPDQAPGTLFAYNQPPVLALATILQRLAGERLVEYLRPRVLDPLGIGQLSWTQFRPGVDLGFSGVHTDLDAVARLGQLYLDDGCVAGRRLLPEGWVAAASTVQIENPQREEPDWSQGYGFQLWRSRHGYRGDGAFGQYMLVLPEHDATVALFSCTSDMQLVLDLVWEHLLPSFDDACPIDPAGDDRLTERLLRLELPTVERRIGGVPFAASSQVLTPAPPTAATHRTITAIELDGDRLQLFEGEHLIEIPLHRNWVSVPGHPIAASATASGGSRLAVDLVFLDTPHRLELLLDLSAGNFAATWPNVPLFGAGITPRLASMRAPA